MDNEEADDNASDTIAGDNHPRPTSSGTSTGEKYKTRKKRLQRRRKRQEKVSAKNQERRSKLQEQFMHVEVRNGHKFVWPNCNQAATSRAKTYSKGSGEANQLRKQLSGLKDAFISLKSRHKFCTHERLSRQVSARTTLIVENAVMSNSYSYHQDQLDEIPLMFYKNSLIKTGMTTIYDSGTNTKVHILAIDDENVVALKEFASDECRAATEFRILQALHTLQIPFVIRGIGLSEINFIPHFLITEYYVVGEHPNSSVDHFIRSGDKISKNDWVRVAWSLCIFLKHLHQANYIHNKIYPENVIISDIYGEVVGVVADVQYCCLAKKAKPLTISQKAEVANNIFVAPEIKCDKAPSFSSDIFSLGSFIYHLCFHASLPKEFVKVAMACMESDSKLRISASSALIWFEEIALQQKCSAQHRPKWLH